MTILNNVRRALLALSLLFSACASGSLPVFEHSYLNDQAKMLSDTEAIYLRQQLGEFYGRHGAELVVLSVDLRNYAQGYKNIDQFAEDVYYDWGVGLSAERDGILLVLSLDGRVAIRSGATYPSYIYDEWRHIIDEVITLPLRRKQYSEAVVRGSEALMASLDRQYQMLGWFQWHILVACVFLCSLPLALRLRHKKGLPWYSLIPALPGFVLIGVYHLLDRAGLFDGTAVSDDDSFADDDGD